MTLLIFQIVKLAFVSNDRFSSLILIGIGIIVMEFCMWERDWV